MADSSIPGSSTNLLTLTAQIVAAHVAGNSVSPDALPSLIQSVHNALSNAGKEPAPTERPQPAVPVKKSVQQDYLICLEDGAKMKMLKRYLAKRYDLTPTQYREKWGLPPDYPMVAPGYAQRRSDLAKEIGLGRKAKAPAAPKSSARGKGGRSKAATRRRNEDNVAQADV